MLSVHSDDHFMGEAVKQSKIAFEEKEVPVGAVVVNNNKIIARAYNQTERLTDVTAHAEILAITAASNFLGSKYLNDCTLYVTLEPCVMCAGALYWAQIGKVVIGAKDEKRGFLNKGEGLLHPKTELEVGVREEDCTQILVDFFKELRS